MERAVAARLAFKTVAETKVALAVAVARNGGYGSVEESLTVTAGGEDVPVTELSDHHGGRFHYMEFAEPTEVLVEYSATVTGLALPEEPGLMELIRYVRPSRYAESDRLLPTAYAESLRPGAVVTGSGAGAQAMLRLDNTSTGPGLWGSAKENPGVYGTSTKSNGVSGVATSASGAGVCTGRRPPAKGCGVSAAAVAWESTGRVRPAPASRA